MNIRANRLPFVLVALFLVLALAVPTRAGATTPQAAPELTLAAALDLMPDTPDVRRVGVWYADYARAQRTYNVTSVDTITDTRISRYFQSIVGLRPGPETGVSALASGWWRQTYGYDLMQITSEIYTRGASSPSRALGIDVGSFDTSYIAGVLAQSGYSATLLGSDSLFTQTVPATDLPRSAMNAVALDSDRFIAGAAVDDVITASLRLQRGTGTLGHDRGYRALAAALGPVDAAFLAANAPPSPFEPPPGGHRGPRLHPFTLYALAYQEPQPGRRFIEIALDYTRAGDARADAATLRARLRRESLPVYGDSWARLTTLAGTAVRGSVLLARLQLRPSTPPTLWLDASAEGDLSILSP